MVHEPMFCAVFDLDGTLADTSGDLLDAANAQFEAEGLGSPLTSADRNTALLGGRAMLNAGAKKLGVHDESFAERRYLSLLEHYEANLSRKTVFYPNAVTVLENLRAQGWKTAICTNKPVHLAVKLIEELGASHLFDSLIGVNSIPERKPDPKPLFLAIEQAGGRVEKSVLVGDTGTDYHAAKNAECGILLVDFDDTDIGQEFPDAPLVEEFAQVEGFLTNWRNNF